MIGVDTNILVRYLTQDDEAQFGAVLQLLDRGNSNYFISNLVLAETRWVLALHYQWTAREIAGAFERLLSVQNLAVQNEVTLRGALARMRRGSDFLDELIITDCQQHRCSNFATFDTALAKRWKNWAFVPKS